MSKAKGAVSIEGLLDSDESRFVGLLDNNGDPVKDDDGVECGFRVTSSNSPACKAVTRKLESAAGKLKPGKRLAASKVRASNLDMLKAATVEIVGKFATNQGLVTLENVRDLYDESTVIFNNVGDIVGTPEVFTKGAMEQDAA